MRGRGGRKQRESRRQKAARREIMRQRESMLQTTIKGRVAVTLHHAAGDNQTSSLSTQSESHSCLGPNAPRQLNSQQWSPPSPSLPPCLPSPSREPSSRRPKPTMASNSFRSSGCMPQRPQGLYVNGSKRATHSMMSHAKASQILPQWSSWESLSLIISGLPFEINTFTVWKSFERYGSVEWVELFENRAGKRDGRGKVRFRPPPKEAICPDGKHRLELPDGTSIILSVIIDPRREPHEVVSPLQPGIRYPAILKIPGKLLEIGPLIAQMTLLPLRTIGSHHLEAVHINADLKRREISIFFKIYKLDLHSPRVQGQVNEYKLRVPFVQLTRIFRRTRSDELSIAVSLDYPPLYHRKLPDATDTFSDEENTWKSANAWYRQTDIVHVPQDLVRAPISLRKFNPLINIGRWTTFRLTFDNADERIRRNLERFCNILQDFNVEVQDNADFKVLGPASTAPTIWQWIDPPSTQPSKPSSSLEDLAEDEYTHLPFSVRYQVEVCLSHGYLNEYAMGKEFAIRLASLGERKARDLLEHVATERKVFYDPMKIFNIPFVRGATNVRIPKYCCYMRSARVTPSTIYFNTPSVDISNRVIRHYIEYADRFLRVRFTDEKYEGRINSPRNNTMDEVFTRIKRAMMNGITIGDRRYEFLAFGNSQFREHGAYFFASLPHLTAAHIRAWMGHFSDIKVIAKHAARLGQCFSTTRAVTGCPVQICEIDDIERNGFTFSDGVGRISRFLAQMVMTEFKIRTPSGEPPSVYQFRLGGCKGILTVSPKAQRQEVHIRKSQYKFAAVHNGLEIIRHSQFAMATLNRQLIVVLSALEVPDQVFIDRLRTMLENLDLAMTSESRAVHLLQKYIDPNEMTLLLADMIQDGFQQAKEPFVTSLLELWRAWQIKYLKEKAKIVIEKGACLFGCLDETATLQGYFVDRQPAPDATYEEKLACLPEIFVQVSHANQGGKYEVIEGPCMIARNPSLHPGDIRVVRAVNVPALHHLKDVVVFPQTGDRDLASMCSGGDLDGDDYLVIWDQDMLPKDWFRAPMDYTPSKAFQLSRDVTVNDITSFFVTYMKNDRLPQIAHAHLALADYLDKGVNDEKCLRLASLHSAAVDYNKTGIPARMTKDLIPKKWPHFMEKKHKPKEAQYVSKKILGQLYDIVERVNFRPKLEAPFDKRILDSGIVPTDEVLATATELKEEYDADMHRIMAQHEIKTEFEVWSTFVLSHANMSKDYKFHEELGQISSALRERYLNLVYEKAGGKDFKHLAPFAVAMYRVTCDQVTEALKRIRFSADGSELVNGNDKLPLISFPWVLQPVLGNIANQRYDAAGMSEHMSRTTIRFNKHMYGSKRKQDVDGKALLGREIKTADGVQKAGGVLELFHTSDPNFDPPSGLEKAFDPPKSDHSRKEVVDTDSFAKPASEESDQTNKSLSDFDVVDDFSFMDLNAATSRAKGTTTKEPVDLLDFNDYSNRLNGLNKTLDKKQMSPKLPARAIKDESTPQAMVEERRGTDGVLDAKAMPLTVDEESSEDIIELEGDVGPSAVDQLEQLLGL
ncbi:hypothetical protein VTO42DRAFT_1664 [Malbranchea cinnamomea]